MEEIENDIKKKNKLPKTEILKINKKIFTNILIANILMLFFCFLSLGFVNIEKQVYIMDLKVFAISLLVIAIVIFEKSYKKDDGIMSIYGIEVLVLALCFLFGIYTYILSPNVFILLIPVVSYMFAIYYVGKAIIIYKTMKKKYIKSLSDIKEIVKKEKPKKAEETKRKENEKEEFEKSIKNTKKPATKKKTTSKEIKIKKPATKKKTTSKEIKVKKDTTKKNTTKKSTTKKTGTKGKIENNKKEKTTKTKPVTKTIKSSSKKIDNVDNKKDGVVKEKRQVGRPRKNQAKAVENKEVKTKIVKNTIDKKVKKDDKEKSSK